MEKNFKFGVFQNDKNIDLTIFQYGWEQCTPLHSYGPAKRNHYLFHFIFSGKGYLSSNDSSGVTHLHRLEACQGFLICPDQVNTYYADEQLPWEYAWVEFDGVKALEFLDMMGLSCDSPVYIPKKREYSALIRDELMHIIDNPGKSPIYQIGHLYLLFDCLIRCSSAAKTAPAGRMKDFYIKEAISFIEQNYSRPITVEDIAVFCNLNRNYLGKLFREGTNQTLQHFLMYYRMNRASELLKFSDMSVGEVGRMCGYPNQLHFSRAYKTIFGVSPNHWREQNRPLPRA